MMKKIPVFQILFFLTLMIYPEVSAAERVFRLGLSETLRSDQLDWHVGGYTAPGNYINVLSELIWDDLKIWQLGLHGEVAARESDWPFLTSVLRAEIKTGIIHAGDNRDSDYAGNDRTLEFSRSENSADEGETFDASIAVGVLFDLGRSDFSIGPLFGYSWHEQQLRMTDGWQSVSNQSFADIAFGPGVVSVNPLGPFYGLDSSYDTEWWGPWAGVECAWEPSSRWQFRLLGKLHSVDYNAEADWNLRTDFAHPKSFEHTGDGYGAVVNIDGSFLLWRQLVLSGRLSYGSWTIEEGRDRTFFASGASSDTALNEVNWESTALSVSFSGLF